MFFGAPVWPCQWHPPYDDVIRRLAALGMQGVELIAWTPDIMADYYTPNTIRDLNSLIADLGMTVTSYHHPVPGLGSPDAGQRNKAIENFKRAVDIGASLGAPYYAGTTPYPFNQEVPRLLTRATTQEWQVPIARDLDWTAAYDTYVEALTTCCVIAGQANMGIVVEPHPFRWVNSAQSMLRLIERTGAENLGLNLDPSHLFPVGDIPHYTVYQLGSRIYHTHLVDNDGLSNAHWRPGKGKVDWSAVLQSLQDVGYTGAISIELEDTPGAGKRDRASTPELDVELRKSVDYLAAIMVEEGIPTRR